jgi:MFS family permease
MSGNSLPTAARSRESELPLDAETHNPIAAPATRRLLPSIGLNSLALFATLNGLWLILLPAQIAGLDEVHKVTNLAIINIVTLIFTVIVQPIIGTFSDRTRSPFGRRAPWMLGAALVLLGAVLVLGHLQSFGIVVVFWVFSQIGIQTLMAPLTAIIPDRYPRAKRGIPSSMLGFGTLVGAGIGAVVAGMFVTNVAMGYTIFGIAVIVTTLLFVLVNRDRSSAQLENPPLSARDFFAGLWISPRKNPDFAWAFASRFVFYLGFFSSFALQLYILTDYIHMPIAKAGPQVGINQGASLPLMVIAVLLSGWLSDKTGRRKVFIYIAAGIVLVGMVVPILVPTVLGSLIWILFMGAAFGVYASTDTALLTEVLPHNGKNAAKDLGILNIATSLPQSLAAGVGAIMLGIFGNPGGYVPLFIFAMVCCVISSILLMPVKTVK